MSEKNSFYMTVDFWNPAVNIWIENIVQLYWVCQNNPWAGYFHLCMYTILYVNGRVCSYYNWLFKPNM